jgi:hypothetical protein
VSAAKPARTTNVDVDPVVAAFDNARQLEEPLSPEEIAALEKATADPGLVLTSEEVLERLRPKL